MAGVVEAADVHAAYQQSCCSVSKMAKITGVVLLIIASIALIAGTVTLHVLGHKLAIKAISPIAGAVVLGTLLLGTVAFCGNKTADLQTYINSKTEELSSFQTQYQEVTRRNEQLVQQLAEQSQRREELVSEVKAMASDLGVQTGALVHTQQTGQAFLLALRRHLQEIDGDRQQRIEALQRENERRASLIQRLETASTGLKQMLEDSGAGFPIPRQNTEAIDAIQNAMQLIALQKAAIEELTQSLSLARAEGMAIESKVNEEKQKLKATIEQLREQQRLRQAEGIKIDAENKRLCELADTLAQLLVDNGIISPE